MARAWKIALAVALLVQCASSDVNDDIESTAVFYPGLGNVSCFRIPSIVQTNKNTLIAFAEARHGSCSDSNVHEIATRRSFDLGRTWSDISFAAGNSSYYVGNPTSVFTESNKTMLVFVKHSKTCVGGCGVGNAFVTSEDDGATWSAPQDVSNDWGAAKGALPGPGVALQLKSGRILVVSHHGAYVKDLVSYSDDNGKTWSTINHTFPKMDEAQMTQLPNGSIALNMRHLTAGRVGRAVSISHDDGDSWSPITYNPDLISPVCQASILTIGDAVYFSNPASATARDKLTVKKSADNGDTWTPVALVQEGASAGYSCLTTHSKNVGGILYETSTSGNIAYATFDL